MSDEYDVVVVGGRVAGASSAMLLARYGHRVLMVDRLNLPSDTISTHVVLKSGLLQLRRWGLLDAIVDIGTPPIHKLRLGFGEERVDFVLRSEYGIEALYAPRRVLLDGILLAAAEAAGVAFAGQSRVVELIRSHTGTVTGVVIESPSGRTEVHSRIVLGADGFSSRIGELVEAPTLSWHEPTNAVHYAYYTGIDSSACWFQFTPGVNAGIIPTNDNEVCVFAGRPRNEMNRFRVDPEDEFMRLVTKAGADLAAKVGAGSRVSPFRGTSGLPGFIRKPFGPGWVLVGDSGYTKDPISSHGISDALRDAELAADAIHVWLQSGDGDTAPFERFVRIRDALSRPIYLESLNLARYDWSAEVASNSMRNIGAAVREECEVILSVLEPVGATAGG